MYRDDDIARATRANALIDEIAELEREKVEQAATDQRLEAARRELAALQIGVPPVPQQSPSMLTHLLVFGATAAAAFTGYTLLL